MSKKIITSNLGDFFRGEIYKSAKNQGLSVTEDVIEYLSKVMRSALLNNEECLANKSTTLAELYVDANKDYGNSLYKFKKLGDVSIVKVGLFPGTKSKMVGRGYYIEMGASAYSLCYERSGNQTYRRLSSNIDNYCDIIYGAKSCAITNNILALYDDWKATKSSFSRRRLVALGFSLGNIRDKEEEC